LAALIGVKTPSHIEFIAPILILDQLGIPKYFGPDNLNYNKPVSRSISGEREQIPKQQLKIYIKERIL